MGSGVVVVLPVLEDVVVAVEETARRSGGSFFGCSGQNTAVYCGCCGLCVFDVVVGEVDGVLEVDTVLEKETVLAGEVLVVIPVVEVMDVVDVVDVVDAVGLVEVVDDVLEFVKVGEVVEKKKDVVA